MECWIIENEGTEELEYWIIETKETLECCILNPLYSSITPSLQCLPRLEINL